MKTSSVPVVWYDPPKRIFQWQPGEFIIVRGAVVRRFFRGARGVGSSTEVVVAKAERCRHEKKAERLVDQAVAALNLQAPS